MSGIAADIPDWAGLSLDELAQRLAELPKDTRDEIVGAALAFSADMRWVPSPGPQELAYFCKADLLLFGGSGGAGKSDLLLGLAATAHKKSLIMRSQFSDLDALTERAIQINGTKVGYNGSSPPSLRTVDGRFIQFTGAALEKWQGQPFDLKCVVAGTPVRMADGAEASIETIRVGDVVSTLDGPKHVTRIIRPRYGEAVRVRAFSPSGEFLGSQCQGESHALLGSHGWASYADALLGCRSPKGNYDEYRFGSRFLDWFQRSGRYHRSYRPDLLRIFALTLEFLGHSLGSGSSALYARSSGASDFGPSYDGFLKAVRRPSPFPSLLWPASPHLPKEGRPLSARRGFSNDGYGEPISSAPLCYLDDYSSGNRRDDARVRQSSDRRSVEVDGLFCPRRQDGAAQPIPTDSEDDGRAETPTHTLRRRTYDHPYTKEKRQAVLGTQVCSYVIEPVGKRWLFDIEVAGANSYVTGAGFVNRNCFDEGAQIERTVIKFHLGWIRSTDPQQRTRAIIATNPPVNSQGDWLIEMFRPWLDITYERPAQFGELRWYVKDPDGNDFEVPDNRPHQFPGRADILIPQSRTFIPGKLRDNPYLARTNYQATLDSLEEPLRSAIRDGNFMASRADQECQVIPTDWILQAQARWTKEPPEDVAMTALAADVGAGGGDRVVLAARFGEWYAPLITILGKDAPDGSKQAAAIVMHRRDGCGIVVDCGGGYGGDCVGRLKDNNIETVRYNGSAGTSARERGGARRLFVNKRAEIWWRFREALNPDQTGGALMALPDDPELRAELAAPQYYQDIAKIQIEDKKDVKKRLGRSPDKADAVVMAWSEGEKALRRSRFGHGSGNDRPATSNMGYSTLKKGAGYGPS